MATVTALKKFLSARAPLTHYEVLGVHRGHTAEELGKARRELALAFHPDRNPGQQDLAHQAMARVNLAHEVLSDKKREARYLAELASTHKPCSACTGNGFLRKQRGFKAVELNICGSCGGSGLRRYSAK